MQKKCMKIIGLKDYDVVNYKKPSIFIVFPKCSFKCDKENNCALCQNSSLAQEPIVEIRIEKILNIYKKNPLTKAFVCGGLEPFDTPEDLFELVTTIRDKEKIMDDIVIYTGYTEEEINSKEIGNLIKNYPNIIIKYGRFRPNEEKHLDIILGVNLSSRNQYAKRYNYV